MSGSLAVIELARVDAVDVLNRTVTVTSVLVSRQPTRVPLLTPYCHPEHGGGFDYMPEVGAYCYVCFAGKDDCFILGYVVNPKYRINEETGEQEISSAGERAPMESGDMRMVTADGNGITARRGGIVQIGATGLAQRIYIPIENTVRDYFQRYQARSPLGDIDWGYPTMSYEGKGADAADTPVLIKYSFKETAQEDVSKHYTVEIRAGQLTADTLDTGVDNAHVFASKDVCKHDGFPALLSGQNGVFSVTVYSHSTNAVTYAYQVSRDGNGFLHLGSNMLIEVGAELRVVAKNVHIECDGTTLLLDGSSIAGKATSISMSTVGGAKVTLGAGSAEVSVGASKVVVTDAGVTISAGSVSLGNIGGSPVVTVAGLAAWWASITSVYNPLAAAYKPLPLVLLTPGTAASAGSSTVKAT
ncbi:MAG: hypothetical protein ACOYOB_18960 [Myxococcota bacterium]